jgi:hypothetical protein
MSSAERAAYNIIAGSAQVNLLLTEDMPGQTANGRHASLLEKSKRAQKAVASIQEDLRYTYCVYCDVYHEVRLANKQCIADMAVHTGVTTAAGALLRTVELALIVLVSA